MEMLVSQPKGNASTAGRPTLPRRGHWRDALRFLNPATAAVTWRVPPRRRRESCYRARRLRSMLVTQRGGLWVPTPIQCQAAAWQDYPITTSSNRDGVTSALRDAVM